VCGLPRIPPRPRQPRRAHLRLRRSPQINRRRRKRDTASGFDWLPCQSTVIAVFLIAPCSWRVRLVVRTQPSQGWHTGSTPVRAANGKSEFQMFSQQIRNKLGLESHRLQNLFSGRSRRTQDFAEEIRQRRNFFSCLARTATNVTVLL
jgi:hypothetical protein